MNKKNGRLEDFQGIRKNDSSLAFGFGKRKMEVGRPAADEPPNAMAGVEMKESWTAGNDLRDVVRRGRGCQNR